MGVRCCSLSYGKSALRQKPTGPPQKPRPVEWNLRKLFQRFRMAGLSIRVSLGNCPLGCENVKKLFMSAAIFAGMASGAAAQTAEPTFKGDPSVYKLIFEDANFRVIEATRKPGVHDKAHSHPSPSIVYFITDCPSKTYDAEGKAVASDGKAGTARAVPVITSHSAENVGNAECRQLFVEKK